MYVPPNFNIYHYPQLLHFIEFVNEIKLKCHLKLRSFRSPIKAERMFL